MSKEFWKTIGKGLGVIAFCALCVVVAAIIVGEKTGAGFVATMQFWFGWIIALSAPAR